MSAMKGVNEKENSDVEEEESSTRTAAKDDDDDDHHHQGADGSAAITAVGDPIQLYRPANSCEQVEQLLTRPDLVEDDIVVFLSGGDLPTNKNGGTGIEDARTKMRSDFHQRRAEIRELSDQLNSGAARIDEDGRLVPTEPARPPRADLPPPPPPGRNNQNNLLEPLLQADDQAMNGNLGGGRIFPDGFGNHQEPGGGAANLTFRRICFAVLAVVTAFVCVILQTLPLMQPSEAVDPNFDQLLHELMHVKFLKEHLRYCPDLDRQPPLPQPLNSSNLRSYRFWQERLWQLLGLYSETNCDDGVVHIPSKHVISNNMLHSIPEEAALLEPYQSGIDKIWRIPCYSPPNSDSSAGEKVPPISRCYPGWNNSSHPDDNGTDLQKECPNTDITNKCFRGVHDDVISKYEVDQALRLGNYLILNGGDHFDVHYDVSHLHQRIPSVVTKLQRLLRERYNQSQFQPVAFRIQTAGPMDFYGVNLYQTPALTLNQTTYLDWVEKCKRQNELALYSLPWPFRVPPVRDTCNLLADLEADPRFAIHTSVFLGDGAGVEYRGGVTLYADNHRSNYKPKHKIRRGLTIDGSKGRVVVSSGGIENRRCRLPTRAGLRTVLQIWWDCSDSSSGG